MLKSMTSYGNGEYALENVRLTAEIKSVNNRYRDIILRIPKSLQVLEEEIRSRVAARIGRGRIDVSLQMERDNSEVEYELELNRPLVRSYFRIFEELEEDFGLDSRVSPHELCQMRDVLQVKPLETDIDALRPGLREVLDLALESFDLMRTREGKAIEEDFLKRLETVEGHLEAVEKGAPAVIEGYRSRLRERVQDFALDIEVDEGRMIQEIAIFADKCDITEEIVRTRSHLNQFRHYMEGDEAIGRRLEFLLQEINREVNTMSSKASDAAISGRAVEIKAELEKLREQVQNVE
ncbi:MAG: YicC/YloC family endoribonuclease [Desulfatiglandales bacterium]